MMRTLVLAVLVVTCLAGPAQAQISWNLTYLDPAGLGFNNATTGATRRATLDAVLAYVSSIIVVPGPVTLDIDILASQFDGTGFTGQAIGNVSGITGPGYYPTDVFRHATTGVDPQIGVVDGTLQMDWGTDPGPPRVFNNDHTVTPPAVNEIDLFSILLHEVGHLLGFASGARLLRLGVPDNVNPDQVLGLDNNDPGVYLVWDEFLVRGNGGSNDPMFAAGAGDFIGVPGDFVSDDVFFNGANAVAANGGSPVQVFAQASGSSVSHLDGPTNGGFSGTLMAPVLDAGNQEFYRAFSAVELGILQDLGWTIGTPVPEPSIGLLLGLVCAAAGLRRRRRAEIAA